jgi:hypothetical protein
MLKKKNQQKSKIEQRVEKLSTPDLVQWAEHALYSIGRNLTDYIRSNDKNVLEETVLGAEAMLAVMQELKNRS